MSVHINTRDKMVTSLKEELVGPSPEGTEIDCSRLIVLNGKDSYRPYRQMGSGQEILHRDPPTVRYGVGVLYPVGTRADDGEDAGLPNNAGSVESAEQQDQESFITEKGSKEIEKIAEQLAFNGLGEAETEEFDLSSANSYKPGSIGLSFLAEIPKGTRLLVLATGGRYDKVKVNVAEKERVWWLRRPVYIKAEFDSDRICTPGENMILPDKFEIDNGQDLDIRAELFSRRQDNPHDRLITVCLVNRKKKRQLDESCLFQVHFEISIVNEKGDVLSAIKPYPRIEMAKPDDEEQSIALLYKNFETYAVGHGCAADWCKPSGRKVKSITAECLPECEVPSITSDIKEDDGTPIVVSMGELAGLVKENDGFNSLDRLICLYEKWIDEREKEINSLDSEYFEAANRHIKDCRTVAGRMREGLDYLKGDEKALLAFRLANHAILMQQVRSGQEIRKVEFNNSSIRFNFLTEYKIPDLLNPGANRGKWRAFQIAFLLMSIKSAADGHSIDRKTVELIWFPTGGGKTEAYLGLAAYAIFLRRLKNKEDKGVNVLMRYTLRLLTTQQFQRASGLICAMEYLRRSYSSVLGKDEFSIGIWLGGTTTPNRRSDAVSALRKLQNDKATDNPFVLRRCPWCGSQMGKYEGSLPKGVSRVLGYEQVSNTVLFKCIDSKCDFRTGLPVYVIDEDIYERTPSLVIGTVDKFAMLPWRPEARALFGIGPSGQHEVSPPGLIIQDELHLISGPLGSMCGLYESVIEELCTDRRGEKPLSPKIICSTATIRRYKEQIKALYAREKTNLFPPPGLDASDSFFARYARDNEGRLSPGRKYIGVHAPALRSMQTVQVRTFTSLLQAPIPLTDEERDPWWTLLLFFNSLRELGTTLTLFQSDIPDYLRVLQNRKGLDSSQMRYFGHLIELTGRLQNDQVPEAIEKLETKCTSLQDYPVDVCLASNIIEVGVDIDRLSLMAVVGQPKTTSQYIQVTGRVGRRWEERPGLVITLYGASKPRDRSHYEKFKSYHERLYAQVEPTSVTPFSPPAVERALHAVIVSYIRQAGGLATANSPYPFPEEMIERLKEIIIERGKFVDIQEIQNVTKVYNRRVREWKSWERTRWSASWSDEDIPLLRETGAYASRSKEAVSWATPTSMRNVDAECQVELTQLYLLKGDE